ncbi:hypothetical protein C8F01DRAFT_1244487 [Mycena amicta]|nr:hypothetical protein C8F01DRAFT_1244487 [Mycena amicta]
MPLNVVDLSVIGENISALLERPEEFLIFYANVENGRMWCGDCRRVQDAVRSVFEDPHGPSAAIVYVGSKPEWKALDNVLRGAPFWLTDVPTIVKLKEGNEVGKLVDNEIDTGLSEFIGRARAVADA